MNKPMTIKQAMRQLRVKTHYALAKKLGTNPQTVDYWRDEKAGHLPSLWADRVKLLTYMEAKA
jgi:uncharacterized protein Usg